MQPTPFTRHDFDAKLVAKALQDPAFRARLLAHPTATYAAALGRALPTQARIRVVEETATRFYVILPYLPPAASLAPAVIEAVARHQLTHRHPCWGVGDGLALGAPALVRRRVF
jgi:hypothetical protein